MTLAEANLAAAAFNLGAAVFGTMKRANRVFNLVAAVVGLSAWWVCR